MKNQAEHEKPRPPAGETPPPVVWSSRFSVGVRTLDEQHFQLVEIVRELDGRDDPAVLFDTIMKMFCYASEHFRDEEIMLSRWDYPELDRQVRAHKLFLTRTAELAARNLESPGVRGELRAYLWEWLQHHILEEDMKYKAFFERNGSR